MTKPISVDQWEQKLKDLCVGKWSAWKTADEFQDMWNSSMGKMYDTFNYTEECIEKHDVVKAFVQTQREGETNLEWLLRMILNRRPERGLLELTNKNMSLEQIK